MISKISVDGYKSIDRIDLDLKEFTLLTGVNSAGKSSVIQAILYMLQAQRKHMQIEMSKEYITLGKFTDIKNHIKGNKDIRFEIDIDKGAIESLLILKMDNKEHFTMAASGEASEKKMLDRVTAHNVLYLPVNRIGVERAYELNLGNPQELGSHGEYIYSFLGLYGQEPIPEKSFAYNLETVGMSLNNQVNYWLDYLIGFQIQMNIIPDVDQVVALYSNTKSNRYYRAGNVGTGVTYIASLVIAALSCKAGDTLIIENPEIHLHPRAQSRFVEFLAYVSNQGLQVILETHSDHIYNGVRKCIKKRELSKDKAAVYFLELDESMQTKVYDIRFNKEGAEENHPYGLFDQFDDDLDELLGM